MKNCQSESQTGSLVLMKYYFTVTKHFTLLLPDFTVIVTVPFFFPVICPLEFTVAILELLDLF